MNSLRLILQWLEAYHIMPDGSILSFKYALKQLVNFKSLSTSGAYRVIFRKGYRKLDIKCIFLVIKSNMKLSTIILAKEFIN